MPARSRTALWGAAIAVVLLFATWYATFHIGLVQRADRSILGGFAGLQRPRLDSITTFVASLCDPSSFVFLAGGVVLVAIYQRRPRVAVMAALVMLGAAATTELLKPLLAEPRLAPGPGAVVEPASWPSGHATAAMSLALCAVIVAPRRRRPLVAAVMAAFAVAVCYSFLELGWHYPSDVLGGYLVATTWTLVGLAALWWLAEARPARRPVPDGSAPGGDADVSVPAALAPAAAIAALGLLLMVAVVAARPHAVIGYLGEHAAFAVGAAMIAATGMAIAAGMTIALRR